MRHGRPLAIALFALILVSTSSVSSPSFASAAPSFTRVALRATVDGQRVSATTTVEASETTTAQEFGICVRDASGTTTDFASKATNVVISTGGTAYGSAGEFRAGTYIYFACLKVGGVWHAVGVPLRFTVAQNAAAPTPSPTPSPSPSPSPSPNPAPAAGWSAPLTGLPTGTLGCKVTEKTIAGKALAPQWGYWDNCGASVVDPAADGIADPPGSNRAVKWVKAAGSDQVYQKLNRFWTADDWPTAGRTAQPRSGDHSPADVSGDYVSWLYIPSKQFVLSKHGWCQLLQLKENYRDASGGWHQDPIWAIGINNFSGQTVGGGLWPHQNHTFALADYEDRWVKFELRLYQGSKDATGHGGRVEAWVDGRLVDTGYESERHVGSGAYAPLSRTEAWDYPVGAYTSNQTTNGTPDYTTTHTVLYVGPSKMTPLGRG